MILVRKIILVILVSTLSVAIGFAKNRVIAVKDSRVFNADNTII